MNYQVTAVTHGMVELAAWRGAHSSWQDLRLIRPWVAVGRGDSAWDAPGADAPTGTETALEDELYRVEPYNYHPLDAAKFDRGKVLYAETPGDVVRFVAHLVGAVAFPESVDGAYVREIGLFVNSGGDKDSGQLAALARHGKVWWDREWNMRRELIVDMRV